MSDALDEHLDKAFASLDDISVRELEATAEALERPRDVLGRFSSVFRDVAFAREAAGTGAWPASTCAATSSVAEKTSSSGSRRPRRPSGAPYATLLPSSRTTVRSAQSRSARRRAAAGGTSSPDPRHRRGGGGLSLGRWKHFVRP
jgi:hypothetical protein